MKKHVYKVITCILIFIILLFCMTVVTSQANTSSKSLPGPNVSAVKAFPVIKIDGKEYLLSEKGNIINKTGLVNLYGGKLYLTKGVITYSKWVAINNSWYYFTKSGYAATGWQEIDGKKYYFTKEGVRVKGSQTINSKKYIFSTQNGELLYGWNIYNGHLFYQNKDGQVLTGKRIMGDKEYIFKDNGIYATKGWITVSGNTYYIDGNLKALSGLQTIDGKQYIFNDRKVMMVGVIVKDGVVYHTNCYGVITGKYAETNVKNIIAAYNTNKAITWDFVYSNKVGDLTKKENKQNWILIKDKAGYYRIKNLYSKRYLTYSNNEVYLTEKKDDGSQLWIITTDKDGYKMISPKLNTKKYIGHDNIKVKLYNNKNSSLVKWKFENAVINTSQKNSGTIDFNRIIQKIDYNLKNTKDQYFKIECFYEDCKKIADYYFNKFLFDREYPCDWNGLGENMVATIWLSRIREMETKNPYIIKKLTEWSTNCGISQKDDDRTKVRKISKKISLEYKYIDDDDSKDLYSSLKAGGGVCWTYATIFDFMCKYWNIPVKYVTLDSKKSNSSMHELNRVFVDGKWYYSDPTWCDGDGFERYLFMKRLDINYSDYVIKSETIE